VSRTALRMMRSHPRIIPNVIAGWTHRRTTCRLLGHKPQECIPDACDRCWLVFGTDRFKP